MANIIKFPRAHRNTPEPVQTPPALAVKPKSSPLVIRIIWVIVVLLWPFLRWILSIDCFIQLLLVMYHWDTAPLRAGLTFALHFAALTALTYFVGVYQPKGL